MTTEWSRHYAATGHLELPNEPNGHENGNGAHDQHRDREPAEQSR
jgi:hypothetical protein